MNRTIFHIEIAPARKGTGQRTRARATGAGAALAIAALAITGLAGCGGDDDTPTTPAATAQVPASASASVGGFIAYLQALVVAPADTLEPVDIASVKAPTSDTTEPTPIQ